MCGRWLHAAAGCCRRGRNPPTAGTLLRRCSLLPTEPLAEYPLIKLRLFLIRNAFRNVFRTIRCYSIAERSNGAADDDTSTVLQAYDSAWPAPRRRDRATAGCRADARCDDFRDRDCAKRPAGGLFPERPRRGRDRAATA